MTTAHMLARSRAAQHVEECLDVLAIAMNDKFCGDEKFRHAQGERIAAAAIAIYLGAIEEMKPRRRITTCLHRRDRVIGTIGL